MRLISIFLVLLGFNSNAWSVEKAGRLVSNKLPPTTELKRSAPVPTRTAVVEVKPKYANKIWISPLILLMQYERNNEQEMQWQQNQAFAASYSRNNLEFLVEYTHFETGSGNQTSDVRLEVTSWNMWVRLVNIRANPNEPWAFYMGLAGGAYQQNVKTKFLGDERTDTSAYKAQFGAKAGFEYRVPTFASNFEIQFRLEARALTASDFDPNPLPSLQGNFGIAYNF